MIDESRIHSVETEIKRVVDNLFSVLEEKVRSKSDLVLFLENGHKSRFKIPDKSEYVIGPGEEYHDDRYRREFYIQYLKGAGIERHKNLEAGGEIDDLSKFKRFSLFLELMIYCHLWENKLHLRDLKQIARLLDRNSYNWDLTIPDYNKGNLIRTEIRDVFINHGLEAGDLINSIYNGQIRNAFAHSQFTFMPNGDTIILGNYDGKYHNLSRINEYEWENYFLKSTLFFHHFFIKKEKMRVDFGNDNPVVNIDFPISPGRKRQIEIYWHNPGYAYTFSPPSN
ncbi:MAG: hypothetical protein LAT75_08315 [Candidatus Cyclonatronum sp.]|uniref:hypothetical protein n=1 Tax=Cyclonatronum sp. TaxID=3024185 RepID=UPI0025BEBFF6|nr:hypothetical protein [Cyclonatronum sp.]MCH8486855.1 hypothetical protein [Cyclonatronum sp.]